MSKLVTFYIFELW